MRGLFFKIFAIFWIAQSLIFVISTAIILTHRRPSPGALVDALYSSLRNESQESIRAFETGGCGALSAYAAAHDHNIVVENQEGQNICGPAVAATLHSYADTTAGNRIAGEQTGQQYVWRVPVTSSSGRKYTFLLIRPHAPEEHSWYQDLLHFAFPQMLVAIAVGGVTTYALALLFTRPLARLRQAARELARGNLKMRVRTPAVPSRLLQEDEFNALVHDFNHMAARLESLVGAQQMLLRDVSHELRSPLARLSVALELAREDASPDMDAHLNRIERETDRLNQLIGQLLTLSSMEAIEKADAFEPVSLNQIVDEMIPDAEYEARQRQSSVCFHAAEECAILGNRELLYRAIENVLRNAVRYTEPGSEVEVRLSSVRENGTRRAVLEVRDHGPGIPEAEMTEIFRPFYRVDRARSAETGGFGVGLAIADRAVKLHHGKLEASNRTGGGASVRMSFPFLADAAGERLAGTKANELSRNNSAE